MASSELAVKASDVQVDLGSAPTSADLLADMLPEFREAKSWDVQAAWKIQSEAHEGEIFVRSWVPKAGPVKGLIFMAHGVNEHISRYSAFARHLTSLGWAVVGHDHWGHGKSGGFRGDIEKMSWVISDIKQIVRAETQKFPGVPTFLFAHSMGTVPAFHASFELEAESPGLLKGVVLSGNPVVPGPSSASPFGLRCLFCLTQSERMTANISSFMARHQPRGPLAPVILSELTHDPSVLEQLHKDKLHIDAPILNRTGFEIFTACQLLKARLPTYRLPLLLVHGAEDSVTLPIGSTMVYNGAGSTDKSLKLYPGLFHEILFEVQAEKEKVYKDIVDFLTERAKQGTAAQVPAT